MVCVSAKIIGFSGDNTAYLDRACYCALPVLICGYVLLGASLRHHLSLGILLLGWGLSEVATMIITTAVCESFVR